MAKDVITRFKLETTGFDSKIKEAAKELSAYSKTATQAKEGFDKFTKANVDAAKALGSMATSTTSAKDRTKELVGAFNDAAKAYNSLTKEQQQSDWAKALAGSLTQLQQRIKDTKAEMQGLDDKMKSVGSGFLSGIGDKMSGALQVFTGNMMTQAVGAVMNLGSEISNMIQQGVELARQGEGIRIAFERLGRGDILDGLRQATHGTVTDLELMKAAVKFNDFKLPLEELGTMLAFAQQKAKDTGQSVDYMVDSIVTGLGRKSLMILDNLGLSATEIREKMAEMGDMTKAVGAIIREQMSKAGDYTETAADRATQAEVQLKNAMEQLGRTFAPLQEAGVSLFKSWEISALNFIKNALDPLVARFTEAGRLQAAYNRQGGSEKVNRMTSILQNTDEGNRQGLYNTQVNSFNRFIKERQEYINLLNSYRAGSRGEGNGYTPENRARIDQLFKRFGTDDTSRLQSQIDGATKQLQEYQKAAKDILNPTTPTTPTIPTNPTTPTGSPRTTTTKAKGGTEPYTGPIELEVPEGTTESMKQLSEQLRYFNELRQSATTTGDYLAATEGIEHTKMQMGVQGDALAMGVSTDAMLAIQEGLKESMAESFASAFEGFQINEKDVEGMKEGNPMEEMKKGMEKLSTVMSGLSTITSGLSAVGIKLDGQFGQFLKGVQGVISIMQGVMTIIQAVSTPSEVSNTVATNLNTTALGAVTAALHTNTVSRWLKPFAQGGVVGHAADGLVVPGNFLSGDQIPIAVNSGETILNRAQAGNLLAQLESSDRNQEGGAQPYVDGELIFLGINNYLRRSGMGELVTSNN